MTFPFLYGVMFGDIAHGTLLFLFGLFLVFGKTYIEKELPDSIFKSFLVVRYLLAFMGFFAMYCGWIYNDFTSLTFDVFGSCYDTKNVSKEFCSDG